MAESIQYNTMYQVRTFFEAEINIYTCICLSIYTAAPSREDYVQVCASKKMLIEES